MMMHIYLDLEVLQYQAVPKAISNGASHGYLPNSVGRARNNAGYEN
jgi:hypothetical protein